MEIGSGKNRLQTRFNNFHNWKPVIKCGSPDRWRWGKSPPDYKGLRKIWIAEDLTRKSRTQIPAVKMVKTDLKELGLGPSSVVPDAGADAADGGTDAGKSGGCGCRLAGDEARSPLAGLSALAVLAFFARRRRR